MCRSKNSVWSSRTRTVLHEPPLPVLLLCTEHPEEYLRGALIEAVRYRGIVLGQASQHDAASITGPLDRQVRDAVNFIRLNTRVAARKEPGRVETPQFSPRAVFEAIVNAVVHRDYSLENARIRLFVFDDRLELYSPGALPNTLPIEAMRHRQATRNETLASMLRMLAVGDITGAGDRQYFMEQRGEGVPVIYEETRGLTGRDPVYELLGGAELRLTLSSSLPPVTGIEGEVSVTAAGGPLSGAQIVALYPNKTWMEQRTDSFGRVRFEFHSELPITVFLCGTRTCRARRAGLARDRTTDRAARQAANRGFDSVPGPARSIARIDRAPQSAPGQPRSHVSVRNERRDRRGQTTTRPLQAEGVPTAHGRPRCRVRGAGRRDDRQFLAARIRVRQGLTPT